MKDASSYLFFDLYNGSPLFKNQLDLVTQLLNDTENPYYFDINNPTGYAKALTRLKTYVSQLLSDTVTRSITEDFKTGLILLIKKKVDKSKFDAESIVVNFIEALKSKNSRIPKSEVKNSIRDQLLSDLGAANYIAIITFKPLELDIQTEPVFFSLRNFLFQDLLQRLSDPNADLKFYRFNFPMDTYCFLFWRGLKRILITYLMTNISASLLETLYSKFALKTDTHTEKINKTTYSLEDINEIGNEILRLLNRNRYILVFYNHAPIYGMPLIALNPTDPRNIKVYALLQKEKEDISIYKYSDQDCTLWRVFVWDNLKAKSFAGKEISYSEEI